MGLDCIWVCWVIEGNVFICRILNISYHLGSEVPQAVEKKEDERLPELPLLSDQLSLDELWDMLGECLKELEESHDQHAVLGIKWHLVQSPLNWPVSTGFCFH